MMYPGGANRDRFDLSADNFPKLKQDHDSLDRSTTKVFDTIADKSSDKMIDTYSDKIGDNDKIRQIPIMRILFQRSDLLLL